jgi:hypothetical protein
VHGLTCSRGNRMPLSLEWVRETPEDFRYINFYSTNRSSNMGLLTLFYGNSEFGKTVLYIVEYLIAPQTSNQQMLIESTVMTNEKSPDITKYLFCNKIIH